MLNAVGTPYFSHGHRHPMPDSLSGEEGARWGCAGKSQSRNTTVNPVHVHNDRRGSRPDAHARAQARDSTGHSHAPNARSKVQIQQGTRNRQVGALSPHTASPKQIDDWCQSEVNHGQSTGLWLVDLLIDKEDRRQIQISESRHRREGKPSRPP